MWPWIWKAAEWNEESNRMTFQCVCDCCKLLKETKWRIFFIDTSETEAILKETQEDIRAVASVRQGGKCPPPP